MFGLHVHVCLACLACLLLMPLQTEEVLSLETLDVTSLVLRRCGAGVWGPWCGDTKVYTQA